MQSRRAFLVTSCPVSMVNILGHRSYCLYNFKNDIIQADRSECNGNPLIPSTYSIFKQELLCEFLNEKCIL